MDAAPLTLWRIRQFDFGFVNCGPDPSTLSHRRIGLILRGCDLGFESRGLRRGIERERLEQKMHSPLQLGGMLLISLGVYAID
jgi:hypothetical protein